MICRLVYVSRLPETLKKNDLRDIMRQSRENNRRDGITGLLFFNKNWFLQLLEGDRAQVTAAFTRIGADRRHDEPALIDVSEAEQRWLPDWSMAYLSEDDVSGVIGPGANLAEMPAAELLAAIRTFVGMILHDHKGQGKT